MHAGPQECFIEECSFPAKVNYYIMIVDVFEEWFTTKFKNNGVIGNASYLWVQLKKSQTVRGKKRTFKTFHTKIFIF